MENKSILSFKFLLVLLLGFASIIFYLCMRLRKSTAKSLPPGPLGYPIVGCLPRMLRRKPTFRWLFQLMQEYNTEIACIRLGNVHVIPVTSPELAREFLKKQDAIFASRPDCMAAKLTSIGYLSAVLSPVGDQWKKMRRIMVSDVLSTAMHLQQHEKRREEADHLVLYLYNQCRSDTKNGLINVRDAAQHYCGNVIRRLCVGKRYFGPPMDDGGPGMKDREHMDGLFTVLMYLYAFSVSDYMPWLQVFDFDGHKKIVSDALDAMRKYHDPEIAARIEMWQKGVKKTKEDLLDVLVSLKDSKNNPLLSIQEIRAQVNEIFLAAVDNPSNAIEWTIAEMLNQPSIMERACKEVDEVVGKDRLVQESDFSKLNYIKACIKEAFRLHPVAPFNLPHVSTKDTTVGGYFIPKGSHVLLSRLGLGRNPRVWEDPFAFKPERHIMGETSEVTLIDHELRMLSFSTGRRGCVGVNLGTTMSVMLLARLVHSFEWRTQPDAPVVNLIESESDLQMAKPLIAYAAPRLEPQVYEQLQ